jgi:tetratricopeptide (TPR) repeat protein
MTAVICLLSTLFTLPALAYDLPAPDAGCQQQAQRNDNSSIYLLPTQRCATGSGWYSFYTSVAGQAFSNAENQYLEKEAETKDAEKVLDQLDYQDAGFNDARRDVRQTRHEFLQAGSDVLDSATTYQQWEDDHRRVNGRYQNPKRLQDANYATEYTPFAHYEEGDEFRDLDTLPEEARVELDENGLPTVGSGFMARSNADYSGAAVSQVNQLGEYGQGGKVEKGKRSARVDRDRGEDRGGGTHFFGEGGTLPPPGKAAPRVASAKIGGPAKVGGSGRTGGPSGFLGTQSSRPGAQRRNGAAALARGAAIDEHIAAMLAVGNTSGALAAAQRAIAASPNEAKGYGALAMALALRGDVEEAFTAARRALQLNPNDAGAHTALATLAMRRGDAQAAVKSALAAVKADPRSTAALLVLAAAYERLGMHEEKLAALKAAARLNPAFKLLVGQAQRGRNVFAKDWKQAQRLAYAQPVAKKTAKKTKPPLALIGGLLLLMGAAVFGVALWKKKKAAEAETPTA